MFYSNEVLSSRKYGIATVWLVATLGSKSNLKKINRKAVLDVNVPKVCETVVDPQAPMALRLQSNLLYGISRVYHQQCGYVLSDVQHAHHAMKLMFEVVKQSGLDPNAGRARPEQLILEDDPYFILEFELPSSLPSPSQAIQDAIELPRRTRAHSLLSYSLSPCVEPPLAGFRPPSEHLRHFQQQTKPPSPVFEGDFYQFSTPSNYSAGDVPMFPPLPGEIRSTPPEFQFAATPPAPDLSEFGPDPAWVFGGEPQLLPEPEFELDAEGNLIERVRPESANPQDSDSDKTMRASIAPLMFDFEDAVPERTIRASQSPARMSSSGSASAHAASAQVRREHEEAARRGAEAAGEPMDIDLPVLGEELPEGEAFAFGAPGVETSSMEPPERVHSAHPEQAESESTAEAPLRHKVRGPRVLPHDASVEHRTRALKDWNDDYRHNMVEATRAKVHSRSLTQARKNAQFWIWDSGIGNIGRRFGGVPAGTPFDMFYGDQLYESLTGVARGRGTKRDLDSGVDTETQGVRRVRPRVTSPEDGREGVSSPPTEEVEDVPLFVPQLGEEAADVELPREAPPALEEYLPASTMPWNVPGSLTSSVATTILRSTRSRSFPRFAGLASAPGPRSQTVSPSPLLGHELIFGSDNNISESDIPIPSIEREEDWGSVGGGDFGFPPQPSSSSVGGFAAGSVGPPRRAPTAPMFAPAASTGGFFPVGNLSLDCTNFLEYVAHAAYKKVTKYQEEYNEDQSPLDRSVTFEDVLPPAENDNVIAAQGVINMLTLVTMGCIEIDQTTGFGDIRMRLTATGLATVRFGINARRRREEGGDQEQEAERSEQEQGEESAERDSHGSSEINSADRLL